MTANVVRVNSDYKIQTVTGGQIVLDTINDSGNGRTSFNLNSFTGKTGTGPYYITFAITTQSIAPVINTKYLISGNSNVNYNGSHNAVNSTTSSITIRYTNDPGTFGTGTTSAEYIANVGSVLILGNLDVLGSSTIIESTAVEISDVILTLNRDEVGNGVTGISPELKISGIEIERGTASTGYARWQWDDNQTWFNPHAGASNPQHGMWVSKTINGGLNGIQTNSITTGTTGDDLYLLSNGTSIISVTGTLNYEQQVLDYDNGLAYRDADIIPNIKAVTDKISYELTFKSSNRIRRGNTEMAVFDERITNQMVSYRTSGTSNIVTIEHSPIQNSDINVSNTSYVTITGSVSGNLNGYWPVVTASPDGLYFTIQITTPSNFANLDWTGEISLDLYNSNALVKINDNIVTKFYESYAETYGIKIEDSTISSNVEDMDLTLDVYGTAKLMIMPPTKIDDSTISTDIYTGALVVAGGLGVGDNLNVAGDIAANDSNLSGNLSVTGTSLLKFQGSDPTADSGGVIIYTKDSDLGASGVYFVNNTTQGQLISKSKALAYSIIFG